MHRDSVLLVVHTAYNIIDVTTLDIILLLNGFGAPIFGSATWVIYAFSPIDFTCLLKLSLSSIIILIYSVIVSSMIISILSNIFRSLIKTASVSCAASIKTASSSYTPTCWSAMFFLHFNSRTLLATENTTLSSARFTIVVPFANCSRSTPSYIMFHSSGPSIENWGTPIVARFTSKQNGLCAKLGCRPSNRFVMNN